VGRDERGVWGGTCLLDFVFVDPGDVVFVQRHCYCCLLLAIVLRVAPLVKFEYVGFSGLVGG